VEAVVQAKPVTRQGATAETVSHRALQERQLPAQVVAAEREQSHRYLLAELAAEVMVDEVTLVSTSRLLRPLGQSTLEAVAVEAVLEVVLVW
jgi:hypothetical protein